MKKISNPLPPTDVKRPDPSASPPVGAWKFGQTREQAVADMREHLKKARERTEELRASNTTPTKTSLLRRFAERFPLTAVAVLFPFILIVGACQGAWEGAKEAILAYENLKKEKTK